MRVFTRPPGMLSFKYLTKIVAATIATNGLITPGSPWSVNWREIFENTAMINTTAPRLGLM
ncbi:MAG: hypothetical protein JETCAE02_05680 [Anaerolineaceae bacterium]|nr:MAG: hypothetical protein JETCAE02_05680 [Anaerolineaceae bacterium]